MNAMTYTVHNMNAKHREASLTLEILNTIDNQSDVTQRNLADSLGVALGLTNSYLKGCVRKGLIKIEQAPANRYLYYLTPHGFAEKSRLTAEYLSSSFNFYRRASMSCTEVFDLCQDRNYQRIILCGNSELAEIASLRAKEKNILVTGILDLNLNAKEYIGFPVYTTLDDIKHFDACVITDLVSPFKMKLFLERSLEKSRIFIPDILGLRSE
ncbi:MAG: DNA-binding MarR family transcriptional regulator [Gammaproteobacteria bacterium]|jgi:DNA-binding MarR family transcriptional regulator